MTTRSTLRSGLVRSVIMAGAVGLWALSESPASANFQQDATFEEVAPPRPGKPDDSAPVITTYLVGFVLLAAAVGANLIPPKRGHQD